ncbi:bifunctional Tepsin [Babesia duncani]|uniref:Bifunctional Tepsin n=1 Tax=Babesia duncani TaxID=323732 RepID=A0AAD9UMV8_9APIC|nr:bifunctional Tepsin [Babesia duncani]
MSISNSLCSNDRNLLNRATSPNSEPTPGYLYRDILETIKLNFNLSVAIEEYLLSKLSRPEPYIKFKCIKLLRYLITNIPQGFDIVKISSNSSLLQCKGYRCPNSEFNSEYLSSLVRTEAGELFNEISKHTNAMNTMHNANMVGFGSNMGHTSTKMEGFGNYGSPPPRRSSPGTLKSLSAVASKYISSSVIEVIENVGSAITTTAMEQIEKYVGTGNGTSTRSFQTVPTFSTHPPVEKRQPMPNLLPNLLEAPTSPSSSEAIQGGSEFTVVNEILTFSGIKTTPSQQVLDDFFERLKPLDVGLVLEELLRRLNTRTTKWQLHLRILCILEAIIKSGILSVEMHKTLVSKLHPMLQKCKSEPQLKNKSIRLESLLSSGSSNSCDILGFDSGKTGNNGDLTSRSNKSMDEFPSFTANSSGQFDLFGSLESKVAQDTLDPFASSPSSEPFTNNVNKTKPKDDFDDLFGDLTVSSPPVGNARGDNANTATSENTSSTNVIDFVTTSSSSPTIVKEQKQDTLLDNFDPFDITTTSASQPKASFGAKDSNLLGDFDFI